MYAVCDRNAAPRQSSATLSRFSVMPSSCTNPFSNPMTRHKLRRMWGSGNSRGALHGLLEAHVSPHRLSGEGASHDRT